MKKKLFTIAVAVIMTVTMAMTAFAGQWHRDDAGWWYDNGACAVDGVVQTKSAEPNANNSTNNESETENAQQVKDNGGYNAMDVV